MSDPIVGIDLGTSNSVVAYADEAGTTRVLADEQGYKIHPSVVSFHPNGGVVVGAPAKQRKVIDPQNTIYSVKRLIGRAYSSNEVKTAKKRSPFQIKEGANELPLIVTRAGEFAVPEISAIVLDHVRNIAQHQLNATINRAVVTVPASFNDAQRSATATAGAIAGLTVVRVLNEPTAAALAYGHTRNLNNIIAVYDFGGGTFDITILRLADQVYEVLGTAGDTFLGGDDLDERLVDKMVGKFLQENRVDLRSNEVAMMRLRAVAEQTKIELSRRSRAVVRVDEIAYGPKGAPLNLQIEITRDEFVAQVADIIDRTFPVCKEALAYAQLGIDKIDDVILVGGTTKIPYVRDQVSKFFAKAPRTDVNPEDAVAVGAALQASSLEKILNKPVTRHSAPQLVPPQPTAAADDDDDAFMGETATRDHTLEDPHGMTRPDALKRPITQPAGAPRTETEYSLPRTGTREVFEERTPPPVSPGAGAIGRLKPAMPRTTTGNMAAALPGAKTIVAEAPKAPPPTPPHKPRTQLGIPVVPRGPELGDHETTALGQRYPAPAAPPPSTTQRGMAAAPAPAASGPSSATTVVDLELEPSPASTARGFQAPAPSYPQQYPVVAQQPTLAPQPAPYAPPRPPTVPPPAPSPPQQPTLAPQPAAYLPPQPLPYQPPAAPQPPAQAQRTLAMQPAAPPPQPAPPPAATYRSPTILDVTPRSLGIATVAGFCEELIRRNSRLPTEMVKLFTTSRDKQDAVRIVVCQGESRRLDNNTVIGDLRLEGLPARARGETSIEVTVALDASGRLQ
ncbi:MAG: Hsp70 family protein, partial [Myxococcales bacterium]|nr:Hsp70 family protein [Myxococcales bacterium]